MRRFALVGLLAGCATSLPPTAPRFMIEDFESGRVRWRDAGSGWKRTEVALIEGGVGGRRAARIEFSGRDDGTRAWTDLTWPVERRPDGGATIVFWARAPRPCRVLVKVNLGPGHEELEMWARTLELSTAWREYAVPVSELTEFLWGHRRSAAVDAARIVGIGFAELDVPTVFEVDRIGIR